MSELPLHLQDTIKLQQDLKTKPESYWIENGENMAFSLFHEMANRVPAYKDFLKKNKLNPKDIKSIKDFHKIPLIDKENYLRQYPREQLCWDGKFSNKSWVISTTSGSTGEPYYFPRQDLQDEYYALTAELYLRENFQIQNKSTLYINAFAMGAWIGGLYTYEAVKRVAAKGYHLSIISPGLHKTEIINAVIKLSDSFDQIIIGAYAPFVKDVLDDGKLRGINWKALNLGFIFSAEAFSENFRDYIFKTTSPGNTLKSTLNHYGTVDMGTMAHETIESILLRRTLVKNDQLQSLLPEKINQPTICQYIPELFYFENDLNNLVCSSNSGLPLTRYNLKDYGGVITKLSLYETLLDNKINFKEIMKNNEVSNSSWNLPFVYVYERNDFSVSYYAFLIYPDMVRRPIQHSVFNDTLTGKFTMSVDYDKKGRQQFNIQIELKQNTKKTTALNKQVQESIHENLLVESSEYQEIFKTIGSEVMPKITLWNYEDPTFFKVGTKQKWVMK